jgi:pyruvate,water dikinase
MNSHESFETIEMPVRIAVSHLEALGSEDVVIPRPEASGDLVGKRVAGAKEVVGRVRVVRKTEELESFEPGEILVARFTDPTWSTVFATAGGLITEVGGWLSHAAIQAREYGLACIVDVNEARSILKTGQIVRLCLDGSIEQLADGAVTTESGRILRFDGTTTELSVDVKTTPSVRKNA